MILQIGEITYVDALMLIVEKSGFLLKGVMVQLHAVSFQVLKSIMFDSCEMVSRFLLPVVEVRFFLGFFQMGGSAR